MKYIVDKTAWQEACNGIACAFCPLADEKNGECRIRNYIQKQPKSPQWIPCSERLPEKDGKYLVTRTSYITRKPEVTISIFDSTTKEFYPEGIAWTTLPEPYKGEGE